MLEIDYFLPRGQGGIPISPLRFGYYVSINKHSEEHGLRLRCRLSSPHVFRTSTSLLTPKDMGSTFTAVRSHLMPSEPPPRCFCHLAALGVGSANGSARSRFCQWQRSESVPFDVKLSHLSLREASSAAGS